MEFVARLPHGIDQAMTLFQMRRIGVSGEFINAANASDVQLRGTVPDDRIDALAEALKGHKGALHVADRHIALLGGSSAEHASIEAAEKHLGGPFTMPGTSRATWAFGGDAADHIVQVLYIHDGRLGIKAIQEATGRPIEHVMKAVKALIEQGTLRRYRKPGDTSPSGEEYALAGTVQGSIASTIQRAQLA